MAVVIDQQKLNSIFSQLKELVGPGAHGAFVLFVCKDNDEGEDFQVRGFGARSRQIGLTAVGTQYHNELQMAEMDKTMRQSGPESD